MSKKKAVSKSVDSLLSEKKIYQIVNPRLVQAPPTFTVNEAVRLMQERKAGSVVIAEKKKPGGFFTETDIIQKIMGCDVNWSFPVRDYMTPNPVCLRMEDTVGQAIDVMGTNRFYHIPLVNEKGELVNVISVRTLIRFLAEFYPAEVLNLPPVPDQIMESREGG